MMVCRPQTSRQFLNGQLTRDAEDAFVHHIEECRDCRELLAQEAGSEADWRQVLELSEIDDALPGVVNVETGARDCGGDAARRPLEEVAAQLASYLAPSDDPSMIGRIGPYEVAAVIGRGGMGIVLKAFERSLNRNVAIKLLEPSLADLGAARQRFAREARAMAGVSHPHVVPIYAVDQHVGLPYLVMEYIVGETLQQRITRTGPLPAEACVRVGLQIAEGLAAAHAQGLVHRDIKPGNILLDRGTERVRVADFGLARVASDASQTRSGVVAGTPQYMSPEQVRGEPCDVRSDLFSLGSVLYAMCTGHAPFRSETLYGVMQRVVRDRPRSICEQNAQIPHWLQRLTFLLLEKDPDRRINSADELATILRDELSYLTNPGQLRAPARRWLATVPRRRWTRWGWLGAATAAAVLAAAMLRPVADRSPPPENAPDTATKTADNGSQMQPSAADGALLWELDGTREAQRRTQLLEDALRQPQPSNDRWQSDVIEVQIELDRLLKDP